MSPSGARAWTTPRRSKSSATDVKRRDKGLYDAPEQFRLEYRYSNGVKMTMFSTTDKATYGTSFIGSKGWIFTEAEQLKASSMDILRIKMKEGDTRLYVSKHHHRNFIDAVLERGQTAAPAEIAQRAAIICHMGAIAAKIGQPLKFDPKTERFEGNEAANAMITRPMRGPWTI